MPQPPTDAKTLERLSERSYVRDWYRLGLCPNGLQNNRRNEPFRLTSVNCAYMICRSYPALLVVPSTVSDESIRRFCRLYRHSRLPAVTWRHPRTKALLIRGASYHGKGVMGMLKAHPTSSGNLKGKERVNKCKNLAFGVPYFDAVFNHLTEDCSTSSC